MNSKRLFYLFAAVMLLQLWGCKQKNAYTVSVTSLAKSNAPPLQSFAHGVSGSKWLLFGGRTNGGGDSLLGGLHNLNANYSNTSFLPSSFNQYIYVYDVEKDAACSLAVSAFVDSLIKKLPALAALADSMFIKINPEVYQVGDTLYVIGGYGPNSEDFTGQGYLTYDDILKINVPEMISVVEQYYKQPNADLSKYANGSVLLMQIGSLPALACAGGELFVYNDTLYLTGGWNFSEANGGQYASAVNCFTAKSEGSFGLTVVSCGSISDGREPSDSSVFRRRDAPFVAAVYQDANGSLQPGISIYAGVFQPGEGRKPWNNAIYVHPTFANGDGAFYNYDTNYDQGNQNVYSCADLVGYDSGSDSLHTFLIGGIGDGTAEKGFTNASAHIRLNTKTLLSSPPVMTSAVLGSASGPFFGAESALILNKGQLKLISTKRGETEVIDLQASFPEGGPNTLNVGYIYGGIQALVANPGTFGPGKSGASNQVFQVTLTRTVIQ
jgi:hypothetical protein